MGAGSQTYEGSRMKQLLHLLILIVSGGVTGLVPWPSASAVPVSMSVRARIDGHNLHIQGRATVPDGAWIIYAAYRTVKPDLRVRGYARVRHDLFKAVVDISKWPSGKINVDANFQLLLPAREQPKAVIERFGINGKRMTGKDVVKGGGSFRAAIASTTVVKP